MGAEAKYKPKPADDQLKLLIKEERAGQLYEESRQWIEEHPTEWSYMVYDACLQYRSKGRCSIWKCIHDTRFEHLVQIENGLAPYLARWIIGKEPELAKGFKLHRSQADGYDYSW